MNISNNLINNPMKTLEEIKNKVAVNAGYENWINIMFYHNSGMVISSYQFSLIINQVAEEYARQCCTEQIKACENNELIKSFCELEFETDKYRFIKEYIKNTPNVVTTKPFT